MDDVELLNEEPTSAAEAEPATEAAANEGEADSAGIEVEFPDDAGADGDAGADAAAGVAAASPSEAEAAAADPMAARYGTGMLTRAFKDNPELQKLVDANPRVKSQLYQMARRSQDLGRYQDLLPSLGKAQEAAQAATALQQYDQTFYGEDPAAFWRGLYDASQTPGADGQPRANGAYERNVQFLHKIFLDRMEQQAHSGQNNELSTAVQAIRDALGWGNSRTPSSQAAGAQAQSGATAEASSLPAAIRQRLEQADQMARELEQLRTRRSEDERRTGERFMDETAAEVGRELHGFVEGLLANTQLSDYDRTNIARDFIEAVSKVADQDKVHNAALEEILRGGGPTPETRARLVARVKAWARQNSRDILEPILARAGAGLKQRQQQRAAAQARARTEPATAGAPSTPRLPGARDLVQQAETKLGRRLTDREILELA